MNQKCEFFHTEKEWKDAKEILSDNGVEIFYKDDYVRLSYDELTDEEKKALEKETLSNMPSLLPKLKKFHEIIEKNIQVISEFDSIATKNKIRSEDWLALAPLYEQIESLKSDLEPFSYLSDRN